jgi:hypothetical protein
MAPIRPAWSFVVRVHLSAFQLPLVRLEGVQPGHEEVQLTGVEVEVGEDRTTSPSFAPCACHRLARRHVRTVEVGDRRSAYGVEH